MPMTQKIARIFSLVICLLLVLSLFSWTKPVSAGLSVWSAETIPSVLTNILGPAGVDVRDFVFSGDYQTFYTAPGNSIATNVIYKSTDGGANWTALATDITADLVAIAPDNSNLVVIANTTTADVYISTDGGVIWQSMGTVKDPAGAAATAIYAIEISPISDNIQYIGVAGKEAGNVANLWYFDYGSATQGWHETNTLNGFSAGNEIAALAFSPSFSLDTTVVVVTDKNGEGVKLQILNINTGDWNADGGYTGYPCVVVVEAGLNKLDSASLVLASFFQGDDPDSQYMFIGITVDGTAAAIATSGIYRFADTIKTDILINVKIHSIDFNGLYLVAGSYDSTTVYRSSNPSSAIPTLQTSTLTKSPGGDNKVVVAWRGISVVAGTSGGESAFAKSTDYGATFNDISLIDTAITNARDVAASWGQTKVYFVTDDGVDTSLWYKSSHWRRVLSLRGTTNFFIRTERYNATTIYLVKKGGTTIYYNNSSGATQWLTRTCNIAIQDMAVASTKVAFVVNAAGMVSKTTNSGSSWSFPVMTTLANGATISCFNTDNIFVGSQNGYVAYSTNGGTTWNMIPEAIAAGAGNVHVIADEGFDTNRLIYAATDALGQNIMRWKIGTSTAWTDIFNGVIAGGIYGLAFTNNVLYALEFNPGINQSTLWRHISPATAVASSTEWNSSTTTAEVGGDANVILNATPRALKASNSKLWAIKTNLTNKLYSYTDVILDVTIVLMQPVQGSMVQLNSLTGIAEDIAFTWQRPTVATEYELFIAYDEDFYMPVATITVTMNNTLAYIVVGPQQAGLANINFIPGTVYYWKIRVTKPGFSLYSITRYFTIQSPPDVSAQATVQGQSGMITGPNPAFSWQPLQGVTEYQFMLSDNIEMTSPLINEKVNTTAIKVNTTLEYGKTYYWMVRSIEPYEGVWSAIVTFTVAEKPAETEPPLIVEEESLPITVTIPLSTQETWAIIPPSTVATTFITPGYFHIIMLIMVVLLGVVIALIYVPSSKQLIASVRGVKPSVGPHRKFKMPGARPRVRPETEEEREPPKIPKEAKARPATIERSKERAAVVFAAKSFLWMLAEGRETKNGKTWISEKEELSLGKKVADRIRDLTKRENLYIEHPEDAVMLLRIWAQYSSRDETNRYLTKTFAASPENAIRLLKCFLPPDKEKPSADDFTRANYDSVAGVVEPDKVYATLTKVFKFKLDAIEEKIPVERADRDLAFKFMRLHLQIKGEQGKHTNI
jgi:hypothetical protein